MATIPISKHHYFSPRWCVGTHRVISHIPTDLPPSDSDEQNLAQNPASESGMDLNELQTSAGEWLGGTGPESDIAISSRIRLARNLAPAERKPVFAALEHFRDALGGTAPNLEETLEDPSSS